jgi:hypothetical protein
MNPHYTEFKFPAVKPQPWAKVGRGRPAPRRLLAGTFERTPARLAPLSVRPRAQWLRHGGVLTVASPSLSAGPALKGAARGRGLGRQAAGVRAGAPPDTAPGNRLEAFSCCSVLDWPSLGAPLRRGPRASPAPLPALRPRSRTALAAGRLPALLPTLNLPHPRVPSGVCTPILRLPSVA